MLARGAVAQLAAVRERRVSCAELMQATLDRIAAVNPAVNAIVALRPQDELLAEARAHDARLASGEPPGALFGLPLAIKDLEAVRGLRSTKGSPIFRDHVPDADGLMVSRLRAAGAILVGKTNVPEFGLGSQTYNPVYGPTRNAYDHALTAGGTARARPARRADRLGRRPRRSDAVRAGRARTVPRGDGGIRADRLRGRAGGA